MAVTKRIFQLAKEFHCEEKQIMEFLTRKGIKFSNRLSAVSEDTYNMLKKEFVISETHSQMETNTMQVDVKSIVDALGKDKTVFLNDVESSIREHIRNKSWQECLTIVQRYDDGRIRSTWEPEVSEAYWDRMVAFVRGKNYKGYQLDSKLTDGVVELVNEKYKNFYQGHAEDLSVPLSQQLMKDSLFSELLAREIIESLKGTLPEAMKKQFTNQLADIIKNSGMGQNIIDNITYTIGHLIASVISSIIGPIIVHQIIILLQQVIAHILATTAFKTMIVATIKAIAKAKIIAFLVAIFGSILGSVPLFFIIAPALGLFIAYQVSSLPEKMGDKVSSAVRQELEGKFDSMSTSIVNEIVGSLTVDTIKKLAKDIAREAITSEEFKNSINEFGKK